MAENDWRRRLPRFQPDVFDENLKLVEEVKAIAQRKGVTSGQVAIAWVRAQGAIPIPGTTKLERMLENTVAVSLTDEDLAEIQKVLDTLPILGQRYGGKLEDLLSQ